LAEELKHPNAGTIWQRAVEIFGEEAKARSWMRTPRDLFDGRTPEELPVFSRPCFASTA
jgi:uncharacterized protein (DUF2384 family)